MKIVITENRINNLIEKYILDGYPMVRRVFFTKRRVQLGNEPNIRGEQIIDRNIINIIFIEKKMIQSPNWEIRRIANDIDSMFSLDIKKYGSDWGIEVF